MLRVDLQKELDSLSFDISNATSTNINAVDLFDKFYSVITKTIDVPLQKLNRKQKRLQRKPWITKGLLISIKRKQKIHKSYFSLIYCVKTNSISHNTVFHAKKRSSGGLFKQIKYILFIYSILIQIDKFIALKLTALATTRCFTQKTIIRWLIQIEYIIQINNAVSFKAIN